LKIFTALLAIINKQTSFNYMKNISIVPLHQAGSLGRMENL